MKRLLFPSSCLIAPLTLAFVGLATAAPNTDPNQNWPQWRGPLQNGVAPSATPPTLWSETNNIKWKVKIPGLGNATPIIWDNLVFVQTAVPTGKRMDPPTGETNTPVASATPDGKASPPGEPDSKGPGRESRGPGTGGPGGDFGPGIPIAQRMIADGDKDQDQKLSRDEFSLLATAWFDKLDTDKAGKLDQDQFVQKFSSLLGPPPEGAPQRGRGGPGRFIGPGFFGALDANKDGTLTREEFTNSFAKWFAQWDSDKTGSLTETKLRDGLNAALPRPQFGGPGGGQGGGPGRGGQGGRGGFGAQKPTEVQQWVVLCLDRMSGKVLWQQVAHEEVPHEGVMQNEGTFASPSGLTDGHQLFAYFGSRGLYCYDLDGKLQWSRDLGKMRIAMGFGEGSSPALFKDTLVVNWDNEDGSFITALDKKTGKTLWKETRDEHTSWSTPFVVEHDGKAQAVVAATGKIRSYDLATGKVIWECGGLTRNAIPSPVGDSDTVYCMSGFMGNMALAIKLGHTGDVTGTDSIVWSHKKSTPYVPSPLLFGGKLYFFANNNNVLSCLDAKSGQALIDAQRLEGLSGVYASPLGADGRVFLPGRNGATAVLKLSDKLEVLAINRLDEKFDASPAAVGKELFLRGHEYLYCIAEK